MSNSNDDWYMYRETTGVVGPFSKADLQQFTIEGRLLPTDFLCQGGATNWTIACDVTGLFEPVTSVCGDIKSELDEYYPPSSLVRSLVACIICGFSIGVVALLAVLIFRGTILTMLLCFLIGSVFGGFSGAVGGFLSARIGESIFEATVLSLIGGLVGAFYGFLLFIIGAIVWALACFCSSSYDNPTFVSLLVNLLIGPLSGAILAFVVALAILGFQENPNPKSPLKTALQVAKEVISPSGPLDFAIQIAEAGTEQKHAGSILGISAAIGSVIIGLASLLIGMIAVARGKHDDVTFRIASLLVILISVVIGCIVAPFLESGPKR